MNEIPIENVIGAVVIAVVSLTIFGLVFSL